MTCCQICHEPFDHSIHKPHSMSSCPHTYCLKCLEQMKNKKCPKCGKLSLSTHFNMALLEFIPESEYDKLKSVLLKEFIHLNESQQDLKQNRLEKLNFHETKLKSIKQVISNETDKLINILKEKKNNLINECDLMLNDIKDYLKSNFEDNVSLQIDLTKQKIEKNVLNENKLNDLSILIDQLKQDLNKLSHSIKNYENKYEFVLNKISEESLLIGELNTVINIRIYYNLVKII